MLTQFRRREKRIAIGSNNQLGRSLAAPVWVMLAHSIRFSISPDLFTILVTLVARYHNSATRPIDNSNRFQNAGCAHDVGRKSLERLAVSFSNDGLGCQVQNQIRLRIPNRFDQRFSVANICHDMRLKELQDLALDKMTRHRWRFQGKARNPGAQAI